MAPRYCLPSQRNALRILAQILLLCCFYVLTGATKINLKIYLYYLISITVGR